MNEKVKVGLLIVLITICATMAIIGLSITNTLAVVKPTINEKGQLEITSPIPIPESADLEKVPIIINNPPPKVKPEVKPKAIKQAPAGEVLIAGVRGGEMSMQPHLCGKGEGICFPKFTDDHCDEVTKGAKWNTSVFRRTWTTGVDSRYARTYQYIICGYVDYWHGQDPEMCERHGNLCHDDCFVWSEEGDKELVTRHAIFRANANIANAKLRIACEEGPYSPDSRPAHKHERPRDVPGGLVGMAHTYEELIP